MNAPLYTASGQKASQKATLHKDVFDLNIKNHELIKAAYLTHLANGRPNLAITKKRGQVSGGGKKPWRQKGTGRARTGSSRNPLWRGGGIVFGPSGQENYTKKLNIKSRRQALRQALTLAARSNKIVVIEDIKLKAAKTSELDKLINKLGAEGQTTIVISELKEDLKRSAANIYYLTLKKSTNLDVLDVLDSDLLVFTKSALTDVSKRLEVKK